MNLKGRKKLAETRIIEKNHKIIAKSVKGLKWNYFGTFVKIATQFTIIVILMRLVGPKAYGTMAIALSIIALGNLINDSGLGSYLIQTPKLLLDDIRSCFTIQLIMSCMVTFIIFFGSDLIGVFFKNNDLINVMKVLSIGFLFQAFGVISFNILKKDFEFKKVQIANISSYMVSYAGIGLLMAYSGWGIWSLVFSYLFQTLLNSLTLYYFVQHTLTLKFIFTKDSLKYFSFGSKALGTNVTNWSIDSLGTFSIGRLYGPYSLGIYNRTYTLLMYPITFVINMIQVIMFPLYSKFQDDIILTRKTILATSYIVSLIMFPISLVFLLFRNEIFQIVFGVYGAETAGIAIPMILSLPLISLANIYGPLFWGQGRVDIELKVQIITAIMYILLIAVFMQFDFESFIWIAPILYFIRFLLMLMAVLNYLTISIAEYIKSFIPAIKISLILLILSIAVLKFNLSNILSLLVFLLFTITFFGFLFWKKRSIFMPSNIEKEFFVMAFGRGVKD